MPKPRPALLILVVAMLAIAVPASLALGDSGPTASASKGKKKSKKCKKGYVKIKKQCKKKKAPPKAPTPTPVLPSLVPQIGEYTGDALVSSFKLLSYPGAQGRVEMTTTVPVTGCKSKTSFSFAISDRGEYALVNSNKFTYVYNFNDEFGSMTVAIGGLWTSSTTVLGSVDMSETHNGETCGTGVQQFHATAK